MSDRYEKYIYLANGTCIRNPDYQGGRDKGEKHIYLQNGTCVRNPDYQSGQNKGKGIYGLQPRVEPLPAKSTAYQGDSHLVMGQSCGGCVLVQPTHVLSPQLPVAAPAYVPLNYQPVLFARTHGQSYGHGQRAIVVAREPQLIIASTHRTPIQRAMTPNGPVIITGIHPYGAYSGVYPPF